MVDTDVAKFFPGRHDALRGICSTWRSMVDDCGRQVHRGQTGAAFPSTERDRLIAAAEAAARARSDADGGKPWA